MLQARLQIAQTFIRPANGSEFFGMTFRRKLLYQLEIAPANHLVIAVGRQAEYGIGIVHGEALLRTGNEAGALRNNVRTDLFSRHAWGVRELDAV